MNSPDPVPLVEPKPVTAGASQFLDSPQFKNLCGLALAAVLKLIADLLSHWAPHFSTWLLSITGDQIALIVTDITNAYLAIGVVWALIQRYRSPLNPLKLTKTAAAADPTTLALIKTQARMADVGIPTVLETVAMDTKVKSDSKSTEVKL